MSQDSALSPGMFNILSQHGKSTSKFLFIYLFIYLLFLSKLYSPWNSPGQNTGVGSLSFLQGIIPTQGSNPGLPHCRWILYQLSHQESPRILEWVAYPFSSGEPQFNSWVRSAGEGEKLPTPVFWPGELHGLQSMGSQRVGHD